MLKLKKVQILGFKSFCDRTEVQLAGERHRRHRGAERMRQVEHLGRDHLGAGRAVGQEPARHQDGRRHLCRERGIRKPTGMAEVSLTLVDPEVYDGAMLAEGETEIYSAGRMYSADRRSFRRRTGTRICAAVASRAEETEEAVAEAQPGADL